MERVIRNSAPHDNHSYCRLFKELRLEMTGYGPSLFGNRLVRTRMLGGVGAGGEKPPATRCTPVMGVNLWGASPLYENPATVAISYRYQLAGLR